MLFFVFEFTCVIPWNSLVAVGETAAQDFGTIYYNVTVRGTRDTSRKVTFRILNYNITFFAQDPCDSLQVFMGFLAASRVKKSRVLGNDPLTTIRQLNNKMSAIGSNEGEYSNYIQWYFDDKGEELLNTLLKSASWWPQIEENLKNYLNIAKFSPVLPCKLVERFPLIPGITFFDYLMYHVIKSQFFHVNQPNFENIVKPCSETQNFNDFIFKGLNNTCILQNVVYFNEKNKDNVLLGQRIRRYPEENLKTDSS
ncbi:hypothetical protein HMI56_000913 [Coelomomyces lativittatus]|nr:hypothetical protein HMI56_000913 [Coelomomyces lativittatus]